MLSPISSRWRKLYLVLWPCLLQSRVVQHFGEGRRRGHYIALVKTSQGKWCQADDAHVFEVGSFHASIQRRYGFPFRFFFLFLFFCFFLPLFRCFFPLPASFFYSSTPLFFLPLLFSFSFSVFLFFFSIPRFLSHFLPLSFLFLCSPPPFFHFPYFCLYITLSLSKLCFLFPYEHLLLCFFPFAIRHGFCGGFPEEKLGGRGGVVSFDGGLGSLLCLSCCAEGSF